MQCAVLKYFDIELTEVVIIQECCSVKSVPVGRIGSIATAMGKRQRKDKERPCIIYQGL